MRGWASIWQECSVHSPTSSEDSVASQDFWLSDSRPCVFPQHSGGSHCIVSVHVEVFRKKSQNWKSKDYLRLGYLECFLFSIFLVFCLIFPMIHYECHVKSKYLFEKKEKLALFSVCGRLPFIYLKCAWMSGISFPWAWLFSYLWLICDSPGWLWAPRPQAAWAPGGATGKSRLHHLLVLWLWDCCQESKQKKVAGTGEYL